MTIGERIRAARKKKGLTQEELASRLGYKSKSSVAHIENGRDIPRSMVVRLAELLDTTPAYIMGWENGANPDAASSADDEELDKLMEQYDNIRPVHLKRFPLLGEIACGKPIFADEDRESYVMADMDIRADFCLRAKGDSMTGARINDGDIVFIREMPIVDNGEIAAVIIEDDATLKRVYYDQDNGILQLIAENPKYKPLVYQGEELNQIKILGKAVYFMSPM